MVHSFIAEEDLQPNLRSSETNLKWRTKRPKHIIKVVDAAYEWHNYGFSTIGNKSDIERVSIERLQAFIKLSPRQCHLILTGKFDREAALDSQEIWRYKKSAVPLEKSYTVEPPQEGEKNITLHRPSELASLMALYHIPAASHPDTVALSVLLSLLVDDVFGPMRKELIRKQKLGPGVTAFCMETHDPGFACWYGTKQGVDLKSRKLLSGTGLPKI